MRFNAVQRCKSLEYLCLNVACRRRSRFYMSTLEIQGKVIFLISMGW